MSSHSAHSKAGALTDATSFPLGPLTAQQTQDALALYHSLPHHTASGEAVIRRAATTAYTNGFQDAKRCFAGATTAAPESAVHHAEPDVALLASIATCLDHGFGTLTTGRQKALLAAARKVYDEVVGIGYYRQENRRDYLRWLSNEIPGGERDSNKFQAAFPEGVSPPQSAPVAQAMTEAESLALAAQAGWALRRNGGIDWLVAGSNPKGKLLDLVANIERAILAKAGPSRLIASAQQAQPAGGGDGWVSVNDCLPPYETDERVLVYTEGADFAGEMFFDIKADDLCPTPTENSLEGGDARTEVAAAATHWMPRPQPAAAARQQAHGRALSDIAREVDMRCAEIFSEDARQMQLAGTYGALAARYAGCAAMLVRYIRSTSSQHEPDHPTTRPSEQA